MDIVICRIAESLVARAHSLAMAGRADGAEAVLIEADSVLENHNIIASAYYRTEYEVTVRELARHGTMLPSKYLVEGSLMEPEANLSMFDQLLILALFIPAGVTLVATLMALVVTFCIVVLAPFKLVAWALAART